MFDVLFKALYRKYHFFIQRIKFIWQLFSSLQSNKGSTMTQHTFVQTGTFDTGSATRSVLTRCVKWAIIRIEPCREGCVFHHFSAN